MAAQGNNIFLPPSPVVPKSLLITNITNTNPMVVTIAIPNNYVVGQLVLLTVPFDYGMFQANDLTAQILSINGLNFTLGVNAAQFDPFIFPPSSVQQPASLSPAGSRNLYNNTTVPFHSLGNFGN